MIVGFAVVDELEDMDNVDDVEIEVLNDVDDHVEDDEEIDEVVLWYFGSKDILSKWSLT